MNGWKYGSKFGIKIMILSSKIYWLFPKLRKSKYHRLYIQPRVARSKFIKEFIGGFIAFCKPSFVMCESCQKAVGIDYQSEKHGWKYEGYHIWSCPDCKEK